MLRNQLSIPCTGYSLAADFYETPQAKEVMLVLVGFASSKARNADFTQGIASKANVNALVIDYSGHGESPFEIESTRPAQHLLEATIALDWVAESYPDFGITVLGTSYGGFLAAYLTRYRSFSNLILRTPAIYHPSDLFSPHADIDKLAVRNYRKDANALAKHPLFLQNPVFQGQTLIVVHEKDESVSIETTNIYRQIFSGDEYVAQGFKHSYRDPENPQDKRVDYQNAVADWLKNKQQ